MEKVTKAEDLPEMSFCRSGCLIPLADKVRSELAKYFDKNSIRNEVKLCTIIILYLVFFFN